MYAPATVQGRTGGSADRKRIFGHEICGTAVQGDDAELVDSLNVTAVEIERASSTHHVLDLAPLLSPHLWCCACAGERRWRHLVVCNA